MSLKLMKNLIEAIEIPILETNIIKLRDNRESFYQYDRELSEPMGVDLINALERDERVKNIMNVLFFLEQDVKDLIHVNLQNGFYGMQIKPIKKQL